MSTDPRDPRPGVDPLAERRREAAEAEARDAEAKLRSDPSIGAVGPGPTTRDPVVRDPAVGEPVVRDRTTATTTATTADERAAMRAERGAEHSPLRDAPPATAPNYDDDVRYAEREGSPGAGSAAYGENRDPDQLQDEIELLQNRMAQRLDGITTAFEPQNLIASVTGEKNPDLFTTIDTIIDTARRNPLPSTLIGAGLAAMFLGSRTTERPVRPVEPYERPDPGVEGVDADGRRYAASGVADPSSLDRVEENVKQLQDATAARLEAATTAARETYYDARNRVSTSASTIADTSRGTAAWVRENPMAIGLGALAAGALAAGYYTASSPRRRPVPQSRALTVQDDDAEPYDRYRGARDYPVAGGTPMPVSAAAPAPMPPSMGVGTGIGAASAGGVVGSGQIVTPGEPRDTVPATPRGGVQAVGGVASSTGRSSTTSGPTGGSTTGPTAGTTPPSGTAAGEAARDPSRVPSGAGFGSTAASRGEVASKPATTPSSGTMPAAKETSTSKAPAPVGSAAMGTGVTPAPKPGDRLDAMKGTGRTEASSTATTPRTDADRRTDDTSSSSDDLTSIYKSS